MPKVIELNAKKERAKEKPANRSDALYSIEMVLYSQIAILMEKAKTPQGLSETEARRLTEMLRNFKVITDIELSEKKKSVFDGLSDEEMLELVEKAKGALADD